MLIQQTREHLHTLRLTGMLQALEEQLAQPAMAELSFEERFSMLVDREVLYRQNRRLARLLKAARLRVGACVEDVDYRHPRGLEKPRMASLITLDWVRQSLNLCLTGPTGCGKTWLACAFGNEACRRGFSVRYLRLPHLFEMLRIAHGDGSYTKLMNQLLKTDVLILDDWGIQKVSAAQRNDLMEIMDDRYGTTSKVMISRLPTDQW